MGDDVVTILVTGATGRVGRHVVGGLVRAGEPVRGMTRSPEKAGLPAAVELVRGDLTHPETLATALTGVDRVYLFPVPDTAEAFVKLAVEAGVRRIVVLSSMSVEYVEQGASDYSGDHHGAVERAVETADVEWTHVRPGELMANVLSWADSIRQERVVRAPYAWTPSFMVHEADVADVIVTALLRDGHAGKRYSLIGSEALTKFDQVRILSEVLGEEIRYEELTLEQARELLLTQGMAPEGVDWLLSDPVLDGAQPPIDPAQVGPTAEQVTGRPARTFAQWVADHRADFLPA